MIRDRFSPKIVDGFDFLVTFQRNLVLLYVVNGIVLGNT